VRACNFWGDTVVTITSLFHGRSSSRGAAADARSVIDLF